MGKYIKVFKKMWNLVISKPANQKLRRKTAIKIEFQFNRKKKHSFNADIQLQVDQIKKKIEANSRSNYLFKNQIL